MEIKQLEYLIATAECGSLSRAAERLYTTQPNVSKVLKSLEKELNVQILQRTSKGVLLTNFGEQVYDYAKNILKTSYIIKELAQNKSYDELKIASYPSNMISNQLAKFYMNSTEWNLHIEFLSSTVEEVIENVYTSNANIGIVYYPEYQSKTFNQILSRKDLKFNLLKKCDLCIYAGPKHPYYDMQSISYEDLENQKFIQGKRDYFSIIEHIDVFSKSKVTPNNVAHIVHTNSEHVMMNMLKHTDLCTMGMDFIDKRYKEENIRKISINEGKKLISIGYINRNSHSIQDYEELFAKYLEQLFKITMI